MIYGITGKIASGKNFVASMIEERGFEVIDLDTMARDSYTPLGDRIKREFGTLDRSEIAKIVFSDASRRKDLERIIYPFLIERIKEKEAGSQKPIFINGALLKRAEMDKICDSVIYVEASLKIRFLRAQRRSGMTMDQFILRDKAQDDVDWVINPYSCQVFELVNEQNTHLKTDVFNILVKLGLVSEEDKEAGFELPELAKEVFNIPKKKTKKKLIALWIIIPVILVAGAALFFLLRAKESAPVSEESPIEKPEVAKNIEELQQTEMLPVLHVTEPVEVIEAPEIPQVSASVIEDASYPEVSSEALPDTPGDYKSGSLSVAASDITSSDITQDTESSAETSYEIQPITDSSSEVSESSEDIEATDASETASVASDIASGTVTKPSLAAPEAGVYYEQERTSRRESAINSLPGDLGAAVKTL